MPSIIESPELYKRAAEIIERDGWRSAAPESPSPNVHCPTCILGAVAKADREMNPRKLTTWASIEDQDLPFLQRAVRSQVRRRKGLPRLVDRLYRWNDRLTKDQGQEATVEVLRRAARNMRVSQWRRLRKAGA